MNKAITLTLVLSLCAVTLFAQAPDRRVALVVGNGSYAANPLNNPPNDATDVAAALKCQRRFQFAAFSRRDFAGFRSFSVEANGSNA